MTKQISQDFDDEPVYYCSRCHSLKIMRLKNTDMAYCEDCGSVEILSCSIKDWVEEEEQIKNKNKYGKSTKEKRVK